MVHYRLPATGIDLQIKKLQDELHEGLLAAWMLSENDYQCYGRANRMPFKGGFRPEVYAGDSNYREVEHDDKYGVQSFFGIGDTVNVSGADNIAQIHVIFFVHLGRITTSPHRIDLEAREAVQRVLGEDMHGFTFSSMVTGPAVLAEYPKTGSGKEQGMNRYDMHPFHAFRVNGTIRYPKPTY